MSAKMIVVTVAVGVVANLLASFIAVKLALPR